MKKLIAPLGRVIVSVDLESKNSYQLTDDTKIYLGRKFNNLNKRYTQPVNGTVISAQHIPEGSSCLLHHNSVHDVNRIFNYTQTSGNEIASTVKYYSLKEHEIFFYREQGTDEWKPNLGYATALRIFEPYKGLIQNVEPKQIKDTLLVTSGEYKNKAVRTVHAADYEIVYQETNGRENRLIRLRPNGIEDREAEVICILHDLTEKVFKGELLVGITASDCKNVFIDKTYEIPKSALV